MMSGEELAFLMNNQKKYELCFENIVFIVILAAEFTITNR